MDPTHDGYRRLMVAVLDDAIRVLTSRPRPRRRSRREWLEVREWFLVHDEYWPFSFVNLCSTLDLDARRLRRRLAPHLAV